MFHPRPLHHPSDGPPPRPGEDFRFDPPRNGEVADPRSGTDGGAAPSQQRLALGRADRFRDRHHLNRWEATELGLDSRVRGKSARRSRSTSRLSP
jgi:hypothetical protein